MSALFYEPQHTNDNFETIKPIFYNSTQLILYFKAHSCPFEIKKNVRKQNVRKQNNLTMSLRLEHLHQLFIRGHPGSAFRDIPIV